MGNGTSDMLDMYDRIERKFESKFMDIVKDKDKVRRLISIIVQDELGLDGY